MFFLSLCCGFVDATGVQLVHSNCEITCPASGFLFLGWLRLSVSIIVICPSTIQFQSRLVRGASQSERLDRESQPVSFIIFMYVKDPYSFVILRRLGYAIRSFRISTFS